MKFTGKKMELGMILLTWTPLKSSNILFTRVSYFKFPDMNIFPIKTTKTRNLKWDHCHEKIFGINRKSIAGILI